MIVDFILHSLNIFILNVALLQVFILSLAYYGAKIFMYKYYWLLFFYIIYSTLSTQDLVVPINVTLTSTNSIVRIPPSYFVVHGEKTYKFNGLNFKMW